MFKVRSRMQMQTDLALVYRTPSECFNKTKWTSKCAHMRARSLTITSTINILINYFSCWAFFVCCVYSSVCVFFSLFFSLGDLFILNACKCLYESCVHKFRVETVEKLWLSSCENDWWIACATATSQINHRFIRYLVNVRGVRNIREKYERKKTESTKRWKSFSMWYREPWEIIADLDLLSLSVFSFISRDWDSLNEQCLVDEMINELLNSKSNFARAHYWKIRAFQPRNGMCKVKTGFVCWMVFVAVAVAVWNLCLSLLRCAHCHSDRFIFSTFHSDHL